ncbi:MAG: MFS transporter [Rhodospirillales bacterium]|nr:MFS transporter [Rhodospirillales bacterium]
MRHLHVPVWLDTSSKSRAAFAILFMLDGFTRAAVVTVIPIEAYAQLQDVQKVSLLFFGASCMGLIASLGVPSLVHYLTRRWVYSLGNLLMVAAAAFFSLGTLPGLATGMVLQVVATACVEIPLNLYLMDHVRRQDMGRFEPVRVFYAAFVWVLGPALGVFLKTHVAPWAPFILVAAMAIFAVGYFWFLRLTDDPGVTSKRRPAPNPLRYLPRYFTQPRLRLAWILAMGRNGWWTMFFIYGPLYVVTSGLGELMSGAIISIANCSYFLVPLWGWIGKRFGIRALLIGGFGIGGALTLAVAVVAGAPWAGIAVLIFAAVGASAVDGAGNVPFLRAVHPFERGEMTAVFTTYRHIGQLGVPALYSAILQVFHLPAVFVASGLSMVVLAFYSHYIPRRM